jgi:ElaB/YqjD/DUF883 family membrane-anchored ribosome-binding protein
MNTDTAASTAELSQHLKQLVTDAEELLAATAGSADSKIAELRQRVGARLDHTKERLHVVQESVVAQARAAGHATDKYVHEHPWESVGAAAAAGAIVGLLVGLLASRR